LDERKGKSMAESGHRAVLSVLLRKPNKPKKQSRQNR
jgi:hypothetical protein